MADKQTQNERSVRTTNAISTADQFVDVVAVFCAIVIVQAAINTTESVGVLGTGSPVRLAIILAALFFLPGYALTTVLFPRAPKVRETNRTWFAPINGHGLPDRPQSAERLVLSFGLSLVLIPLAGLGLSALSLGYSVETVGNATTVLIIAPLLLGTIRRLQTPEESRYIVSFSSALQRPHGRVVGESQTDTAVNLILLFGVLTAVSVLTLAVTAPLSGATYTDFSIVTQNQNGELVTSGYPSEFVVGEHQPLTFIVDNNEGQAAEYEVVILLERVDDSGAVVERFELDRFSRTVEDGQWVEEHQVSPTATGENLRLTYVLYKGDAPVEPDLSSAYRSAYIWIDVSES
ncbi:DUF1616 domain-containing protein [Halomarina rubra]|uniref:DUF1616 domain-containing protein n=1 Tax=Halomarina rubra TaxID=2071873 RepID=A0ABD6AY37_9EURY